MKSFLGSCVLGMMIAIPSYAQTSPARLASSSSATTPSAKATRTRPVSSASRIKPEITLDTPIVTLSGVCSQSAGTTAKASAECKTVITRGQLDALVALIDPDAPLKSRQQFALSYARLLAATQLAEKKRLEQHPEISREIQFQQKLARMQVLTNSLLRSMQEQSVKVPDKDAQAYYDKNQNSFEQVIVRRLVIPLGATTETGKPVDAAAAKTLLENLREQVLKGDDFNDLQARAFKELGIKDALPATSITLVRRQVHTPDELKIFDLDMGETSAIFDTQGALMFVRLEGKRIMSAQEAKPQIEASLQLQRIEDGVDEAFKGITAEFNLKYMDAETQPNLVPPAVVMQAGVGRRAVSSAMR